jgi:hypothetical protein
MFSGRYVILCSAFRRGFRRFDNSAEGFLECIAGLINAKFPSGLLEPLGLFLVGQFKFRLCRSRFLKINRLWLS